MKRLIAHIFVGGVLSLMLPAMASLNYTVVDLLPTGYINSSAVAGWNGYQFGTATVASSGRAHAALWNGSPSTFADLNPPRF